MTAPRSCSSQKLPVRIPNHAPTLIITNGTPTSAIILQGIWACFLIATGTFGTLFTYVSVIITLFSAFTIGSVIVLRWKRPELRRPYKLWGYPVVPALFILMVGWLVVNTLMTTPGRALAGLALMAIGLPFYWHWTRKT